MSDISLIHVKLPLWWH